MSDLSRVDPPFVGDEKTLLAAFLDYHRATLLWKASNLSRENLVRQPTVSTMSLLGLIKHIAYVERSWFQDCFAGQSVSFPWSKDDRDADWRIEPHETAESVIEFFKTEVNISRQIVAEAKPDELAKNSKDKLSLRWIMLHMLEEYARHNGHADLLRETIDGATGE